MLTICAAVVRRAAGDLIVGPGDADAADVVAAVGVGGEVVGGAGCVVGWAGDEDGLGGCGCGVAGYGGGLACLVVDACGGGCRGGCHVL